MICFYKFAVEAMDSSRDGHWAGGLMGNPGPGGGIWPRHAVGKRGGRFTFQAVVITNDCPADSLGLSANQPAAFPASDSNA